MKQVPVRLGAALVTLALTACGGGGGKETAKKPAVQQGEVADDGAEEFLAAADRLCVKRADEIAVAARWAPADADEALTQVEEMVPVHERFVAALEKLEPGAQREDDFAEYLGLREELIESLGQERAALEQGADPSKQQALQAQSLDLEEDSEAVARAMGLKACGAVLPGDDEAEITAAITKLWVNPERSDCADLKSDEAIERVFGGDISACETTIFDLVSDGVKITKLEGIGKLAWAEYTLVGGDKDGAKFSGVFFQEDGAWKEDYSQEVVADGAAGITEAEDESAAGVTKESFIFTADSICAASQEEGYTILETLVGAGLESDGEAVRSALTALFDGTSEAIAKIRQLPLPAGEETIIRGFLSNSELGLAEARRQIATPEGALELFSQDEGPFADLHAEMHDYGFWQCAGQDPDE